MAIGDWLEPRRFFGGDLLEPRRLSRSGGGGLFDMIREFDNWFDQQTRSMLTAAAPEIDFMDEPNFYRIDVDLPGVRPEDVKIQAQGNQLLIQAHREARAEARGERESRALRYQRIFTLPEQINSDQIKAALENGVLEVLVPKSEEMAAKQVQIGSSLDDIRSALGVGMGAGEQAQVSGRAQAQAPAKEGAKETRTRH